MERQFASLDINDLEEQAMQGSGEAALELAYRYEQGCDGAEQDPSMAAYWRSHAAELGVQQPEQPSQAEEPEEAPPSADSGKSRDELFEDWNAAYREGRYDGLLSRQLVEEARGGNPYAAFVLAGRYLESGSKSDREEARPVLEQARTLLEHRVAVTRDPDACGLLVRVLDQLGRLYAADTQDVDRLEQARDCFVNARELDEEDYEGLLWFYSGPAKNLPEFRQDPARLEQARFALEEQQAGKQGIAGRLQFALRCRQEERNLKARDWLQLALQAEDAAQHPEVCAMIHYQQAEMDGAEPHWEELQRVADRSAWACLMLGDRAAKQEEKLQWYTQGAAVEGEPDWQNRCRQKEERLRSRIAEKQRAEEEARRQAAEQQEAALRRRKEEDAHFAAWYNAYRTGEYDNALGIDLQQKMKAGDPYAAFVLAGRYRKSSAEKERAQALPILEQSRNLLQKRVETAGEDSGAKSVLVRVLVQLSQIYLQRAEPKPVEAEVCLIRAHELDAAQLERLSDFYQQYGSTLPAYHNNPEALDRRVTKLSEQAARRGGILPRLRYALYCHRQEREVAAADWLQMALSAPDAAQRPALAAIARYYQAVLAGRQPDEKALEPLAAQSSWICLILGDLAEEEEVKLRYYRQGAALDPAAEGAASMASLCARRLQAAEERRQEARRQAEQAKAQAEKEAGVRRRRLEQSKMFLNWAEEYGRGRYDEMLSGDLQTLASKGNPYAALVMARRYLGSDSASDRSQAIPLLEHAQSLTVLRQQDAAPQANRLLLDILLLLAEQYAAGNEMDLRKAEAALKTAAGLDPAGRRALLRFYSGPARRMQAYSANPGKLQELCGQIYEQEAKAGGISQRLRYAVFCIDQGRKVKAQDWIRLARQAEDAADHPQLDEVAQFYLALAGGREPDNLNAVQKAAGSGCSWACLALGDRAADEEEKLKWYRKGAEIDPKAEGDASRVEDCTARRDAIFRRRAVAYNADLNRRKEEKAQKARQRERDGQRAVQRSWVTLFGMLYGGTMVLLAILCLLTKFTGSAVFLGLGRALYSLWTLGCLGGLVAYFLGVRPEPYKQEPTRLLYTLLIALAISVVAPNLVLIFFL